MARATIRSLAIDAIRGVARSLGAVRFSDRMLLTRHAIVFDDAWYTARNPAAGDGRMAPIEHYLAYGGFEGRDPHPLFDSDWYLARHPDVAKAGVNPLVHYLAYGGFEGRDPHPLFDSDWYLARHPDVAKAGVNPLVHYLAHGGFEGRDPHPLFETAWYLEQDPDLQTQRLNPLVRFLLHGGFEGRDPHPLFDCDWYLARHPELSSTGINPLVHYLTTGANNGANPNPLFDTRYYCLSHPDVASENPLSHYAIRGGHELRDVGPEFDTEWYLVCCPDADVRQHNPLRHHIEVSGGVVLPVRRPTSSVWQRVSDGAIVHHRSLPAQEARRRTFTRRIALRSQHQAALGYHANPDVFDAIAVSIVMPTWNRCDLIGSAIRSIRRQTHTNWELIVVDDGSTDSTETVVQSFNDPRIRYVRIEHQGHSQARNAGLALTSHELIFYLDTDNEWRENYLRTMVVLMTLDGADLAYASFEARDDDHELIYIGGMPFDWLACYARNRVDLNTLAHHRRLFETLGGFDVTLRRFVDWDLVLRYAFTTRPLYCGFIGATYHASASTRRVSNSEATERKDMVALRKIVRSKFRLLEQRDEHTPPPPAVRFWPDYRDSNPYQDLLYGAFDDIDIAPGDVVEAEWLRRDGNRDVVFHLHWISPVLEGATTGEEAARRLASFRMKLDSFASAGGRLVWTIHNALPHEARYPDLEVALARLVADRADWIHLHSAAARDAVAHLFELPADKCLIAPHGSFVGVYPDTVDRASARAALKLDPDADVFVFVGQLRGYKGLDHLCATFERLAVRHPQARLVIAGARHGSAADLKLRLSPGVSVFEGFIPDERLQLYFRAADLCVLPYRDILTSGSAMLAFSLGVPVVAPNLPTLREAIRDGETGLLYEPVDGGLEGALEAYLARTPPQRQAMSQAAFDAALAAPWSRTSHALLAAMGFARKDAAKSLSNGVR